MPNNLHILHVHNVLEVLKFGSLYVTQDKTSPGKSTLAELEQLQQEIQYSPEVQCNPAS